MPRVHGEKERSVDLDVRHAPPDEPVDGEVRRWWNRAKQLNQTGDVMAAENLLKVWPHLRENDRKIIKVAVDKCGSKYNLAPTTERELPLLLLLRMSTPRNIFSRASVENLTSFAAIVFLPKDPSQSPGQRATEPDR
jgi:hypothetical protein